MTLYLGDALEVLAGRRDWAIVCADVLEALALMPSESVNCVVTSPPYWRLRRYLPKDHPDAAKEIGLEQSLDAYVAKMVEVFAAVRRVLRKDGLAFVNLGDSYSSNPGNGRGGEAVRWNSPLTGGAPHRSGGQRDAGTLGPKQLLGVPWRVALALQADGWVLRSDIVYSKANPMPESVTDRVTRSHEYVFMLARSERYWSDFDAIREVAAESTVDRAAYAVGGTKLAAIRRDGDGRHRNFADYLGGRNKRSVWTIAAEPLTGIDHYAAYPTALVEPCILAACPPKTCPACGAPWERIVERTPATVTRKSYAGATVGAVDRHRGSPERPGGFVGASSETLGRRPTCRCGRADTLPGVVLDPFCGSGTTLLVALRHGRRAVGIDLSAKYVEMARARIIGDAPMWNTPGLGEASS